MKMFRFAGHHRSGSKYRSARIAEGYGTGEMRREGHTLETVSTTNGRATSVRMR